MSTHRYMQVDVSPAVPRRGNALAVVFDAEGLGKRATAGLRALRALVPTMGIPEDPVTGSLTP